MMMILFCIYLKTPTVKHVCGPVPPLCQVPTHCPFELGMILQNPLKDHVHSITQKILIEQPRAR